LSERSLFVRQAANLWQVKVRMQQALVSRFRQDKEETQMIDTMVLPICEYSRRRKGECFKGEAQFGGCHVKELYYVGFKVRLRISPLGMVTHCLAACAHQRPAFAR
jgi:hypothetical protein